MPLDIRNQEMEEIYAFVEEHGEKSFRAGQIYEWVWKKNAGSFDQMLNLPLRLRDSLKKRYIINRLTVSAELIAKTKPASTVFAPIMISLRKGSSSRLVKGSLHVSHPRSAAP